MATLRFDSYVAIFITLVCFAHLVKADIGVYDQSSQPQAGCPSLPPESCKDVNSTKPRVIATLRNGMTVLCDTETDGGGWIVIQRRYDGSVDFHRGWDSYKYGFGNLNGEFWYGNELVSRLTLQWPYELRVDIKYEGESYYARYGFFQLYDEADNYTLRFGGYKGNAGNSLASKNLLAFSTGNKDNDQSDSNCAGSSQSGWWYSNCTSSNLNGVWGSHESPTATSWITITGPNDSVEFSEMKIKTVY